MSIEPQSPDQVEILREIAEERAHSLSPEASDDLFARIERAIDEEQEAERPSARILPFGGAGLTVTVLAAAAAFVLVFGRRGAEPTEPKTATAPVQQGSEVLEVDFGSNAGTHFTVEGERGERLAVVWIDDWEAR